MKPNGGHSGEVREMFPFWSVNFRLGTHRSQLTTNLHLAVAIVDFHGENVYYLKE